MLPISVSYFRFQTSIPSWVSVPTLFQSQYHDFNSQTIPFPSDVFYFYMLPIPTSWFRFPHSSDPKAFHACVLPIPSSLHLIPIYSNTILIQTLWIWEYLWIKFPHSSNPRIMCNGAYSFWFLYLSSPPITVALNSSLFRFQHHVFKSHTHLNPHMIPVQVMD